MARKNSKNTANALNSTLTLAELGTRYITQMEERGKSIGTCSSYLMELKLAQSVLGANTLVSTLTNDAIAEFNTSSRVMTLKSGVAKSQLSIDKTRRVLRLALTWAHASGLLAAPIIDAKKDALPGLIEPASPRDENVEAGNISDSNSQSKEVRARKSAITLEVAHEIAVEAADTAELALHAQSAA
ncbi:MAG: hypothetical protein IT454_19910 [Planctomycetes bacterium]|nr:hypothetical protein [Planctomycetota bacterium]